MRSFRRLTPKKELCILISISINMYQFIRSFVLKFTDLELLEAQPRSNKVIYCVKKSG